MFGSADQNMAAYNHLPWPWLGRSIALRAFVLQNFLEQVSLWVGLIWFGTHYSTVQC